MSVDHHQRRVSVALSNQQQHFQVDATRLVRGAESVLSEGSFLAAEVGLAIVDDATIHELNRRYLEHDFPTDVLSFPLSEDGEHLQGEVVVSADTAARVAAEHGWSIDDELLLYVVHGCLHLIGLNDHDANAAAQMRAAEKKHLGRLGVFLHGDEQQPVGWESSKGDGEQ